MEVCSLLAGNAVRIWKKSLGYSLNREDTIPFERLVISVIASGVLYDYNADFS